MSSGRAVHQLSGGLYVSGPPETPKERPPPTAPRPVPYTGGDVRKSGELGKMFDIPVVDPSSASSRPASSSSSRHHSGPLSRLSASPTPSRNSSGLLAHIPPNLLITTSSFRRSGGQPPQPPPAASPAPVKKKPVESFGPAVTALPPTSVAAYAFRIPKVLLWACVVAFGVGLAAGVFVLVVVHQAIILIAVVALLLLIATLALWNWSRGGRGEVERLLRRCPDTAIDPLALPIGKFVKITGVVTCGSIPLESSYRMIERCVYISDELYEYRGWSGLPANPTHRRLTWGLRHSKRFAADFYISDQNSRTRFLVRAGNGNKVVSFVKPSKVVDMTKKNKDLSPSFQRWLSDNNLSSDDRIMRLKEGLIQEGSIASVMGILRKCDNTLIIDPPTEAFSIGWQWSRCIFPIYIEGLILLGDQTQEDTIYHV